VRHQFLFTIVILTIVILTIVIFTIVIFTIVIFTIVILSVAKDLLFGIVFSMSRCRGSRLRRGSMPPAPWKPTALAVGKEGAVLLGFSPCGIVVRAPRPRMHSQFSRLSS